MFKFNKKSYPKKFYTILACEVLALILICTFICYSLFFKKSEMVMGGFLHNQNNICETSTFKSDDINYDKFFRPSCSPILNITNLDYSFYDKYFDKKPSGIQLEQSLLKTPENALINYYTILKSAAYYDENSGKYAGCGSIGDATAPYPIAYNFLSEEYKNELSYENFLKSFKNIFHINLTKLKEIPLPDTDENLKRYFVELETIEGSDKPMTNFGYYYGFIDLTKEKDSYKISNMDFYGEDFLCAPYHGWSWLGEAVVETKYGGWCKMISGKPTTKIDGYTKNIYFDGTDGNKYMIEFLTLTNNTDVEVAQYKESANGAYERILLNPEKCLKNNVS
ncbi:MAG: hypothetical protein RR128_03070 [Clostridium sp.]